MKKNLLVIFFMVFCLTVVSAQQSQEPSAQAENALRTALANEGTITVIDNSSGAVLKTLQVNPAETALRTPRGNFNVSITNPARLSLSFNNVVNSDLYQVQLPRTINTVGSLVVGAQFGGTRFGSSRCGITILSKRGDVFKLQIRGTGIFYDENNNQTAASVTGIFEATYLGAVTGQGMPQTQQRSDEERTQEALDLIRQLGL